MYVFFLMAYRYDLGTVVRVLSGVLFQANKSVLVSNFSFFTTSMSSWTLEQVAQHKSPKYVTYFCKSFVCTNFLDLVGSLYRTRSMM